MTPHPVYFVFYHLLVENGGRELFWQSFFGEERVILCIIIYFKSF